MDWKTFISQLVSSLAWPSVVLFSVMLLKDKLGELIPRIKKLKHKDTELEFIEIVSELAEANTSSQLKLESPEIVLNRKVLQGLANVSSRSAVIEAYRMVEASGVKAIARAYPDLNGKDIRRKTQVSKMLRDIVLSSDRYHQLRELLILRNKAAHDEEFSLTGSPIETYIDVALSLCNELEQFKP